MWSQAIHASAVLRTLVAVSLLGVCCCHRAVVFNALPVAPTPNEVGLLLYLHPERAAYKVGSPVRVSLELSNDGEETRKLCVAFSPAQYVIRFDIRDQSGRLLHGPNVVFQNALTDSDYTSLAPLLYVGGHVDLAISYALAAPGRYRVKAIYDTHQLITKPPEGIWKGTLESNEIDLLIE